LKFRSRLSEDRALDQAILQITGVSRVAYDGPTLV
jgi:hypothetical protein